MRTALFGLLVALAIFSITTHTALAQTQGSEEDVQIRSIDFSTQVLELHNFGDLIWPLDGWRFCSHDELDGFDYTSATGLNGISLGPGESLFVHWLNDATGGNSINLSALGGNAIDDLLADSSGAAISIGIYRDGNFGSAASLVDYIQFSFLGADITAASPRGGTAVAAELWTAATDWIAIDETSQSTLLTASAFPGVGNAHGQSSYDVTGAETFEVTPLTLDVNAGVLVSGIVEDLSMSDNMDVSIRRSTSSLQAVVELDVCTISPQSSVSQIEFEYESSVFARGNVTQTISLFNYETGSFEEVDSRKATQFVDSSVVITPVGNPSRFVEPGTDRMKSRIRYQAAVARARYTVNADFAIWRVTN